MRRKQDKNMGEISPQTFLDPFWKGYRVPTGLKSYFLKFLSRKKWLSLMASFYSKSKGYRINYEATSKETKWEDSLFQSLMRE